MSHTGSVTVTAFALLACAGAASAGISGFALGSLGSNRLAETRLRTDASVIAAPARVELIDTDQNNLGADAAATLSAMATTPSAVAGAMLTGSASQTSSILLGGIGSRAEVSGRADGTSPQTAFPEEASVTSTSFFSVDLFLGAGDYEVSAMWETAVGSSGGRGSFSLRAVGGTLDSGFLFTGGDAFGGPDTGSAFTTLTLAGDATHYVMTMDLDVSVGGVGAAGATGFSIGSFSVERVPAPGAAILLAFGGLAAVRRRR